MRASVRWSYGILLLAGGCATFAQGAPSADTAWRDRFEALGGASSPEAALERSELAIDLLVHHQGLLARTGWPVGQLEAQGLDALYQVMRDRPAQRRLWRDFSAWRAYLGARFQAGSASHTVCAAADKVRWISTLQLCGDLLAEAGWSREAIERWRAALPFTGTPDERNALIVDIEKTSNHPDADLAGVTPLELQVANAWAQAQVEREREARAARRAEATCSGQCSSQFATCLASATANGLWTRGAAEDDCSNALAACGESCRAYEN